MAGKQVSGDGVPASFAGLSKSQLYEIMCQMKTLIEQNKQQARQILIQNPALTKALFQAQIMLGMVQSSQASPDISSLESQNPQSSAMSNQQTNTQASAPVSGQIVQNQIRKQHLNQPMASNSPSQLLPLNHQPKPMPSQPLQPTQQPKGHVSALPMQMSTPQSSQVPTLTPLAQHSAPQPHTLHQLPIPSLSTQSQQPLPSTGSQYFPLQPPLLPQPKPTMPVFPHQVQAQLGPNSGFQHPSGTQMHHSQHMFHAGSPQLGMDFNQVGSSKQTDRGSNWIPGVPENMMSQVSVPQPAFAGQAGPSNMLPRPSALSPELEKALLQQVMSLTPEQIHLLPADQRNQVLQLQQMLRQ